MGKGKAEFGTPKYIANKMKAKGLQKLRWYCQMCQKQCRDENGFKCHTMSESHQRQLLLFADNQGYFMDQFSREFVEGFLETLKRTSGTKRVLANRVYQDYISYKDHLHMNATRWHSLTGFVKWLGREGKCVVDETEKGWFIAYIDRDPDTIAAQEARAKKKKMDKDDEERTLEFMKKQVEWAAQNTQVQTPEYTELKRAAEDEVIKVDLKLVKKAETEVAFKIPEPKEIKIKDKPHREKAVHGSSKRCALDDILEEEERKKEKKNRKDYWLCKDIVVKVVASSLGDRYYKKKGVVEDLVDSYSGKIRMIDSGDLVKIDQAHLETVIPAEGRKVRIVNGAYRGEIAVMRELLPNDFAAKLEIAQGLLQGRVLPKIPYEDFSKLADTKE